MEILFILNRKLDALRSMELKNYAIERWFKVDIINEYERGILIKNIERNSYDS